MKRIALLFLFGLIAGYALEGCAATSPPMPGLTKPEVADKAKVTGSAFGEVGAEARLCRYFPLKVIPWVELNYPPCMLDEIVFGLQTWRDSCLAYAGIVSTMPGKASLFTTLKALVPNMRIIPGLKTMDLLPQFDNVEGWRNVAAEVRLIVAGEPMTAAHIPIVLLENEKAMKSYVDGTQTIDLALLASGLKLLPTGVEYWWNPSIFGFQQVTQDRNAAVCEVVAKTLSRFRFVNLRYQGRGAVEDRWRKFADARLQALSRLPTIPKLYFYGPGHGDNFWLDEEVGVPLNLVLDKWGPGAEVIIYPGVVRFAEAAKSLTFEIRQALTVQIRKLPSAAPKATSAPFTEK